MFAIPPYKWNYTLKLKTFLYNFQKPLAFNLVHSSSKLSPFSIPHPVQSENTARERTHFKQGAQNIKNKFGAMKNGAYEITF